MDVDNKREVEWLGTVDMAALRRRFVRPASRFMTVEGVDVHVVDEGEGACAIILLSAQWLGVGHGDAWADMLVARGHRVIRVDLPGQGLAGPFPIGDYSARAYARLLGGLVRALELTRYGVVGTSFSGIAAALHAAERPAGLAALVLATSSGLPRPAGGPAPGGLPDDPALAEVRDGRRPRAFYAWKLGTLLCRPVPDALIDEAHWTNELAGRADEARRRMLHHDPAAMPAALPQIAVPALVQWSSGSTYLPPAMAEGIAALIPGPVTVHHYAGTGHLLIADAGAACARDLAAFIEGL